MGTAVAVRRVYDEPLSQDGSRVLVDRLWPRGLRKEHAQLAQWDRDVAPSNELREWYGHDPSKFAEFRRRYLAELAEPGRRAALEKLRALALNGPVTLLTATRDVDHSQAAVLAELLSVRQPPTGAGPPGAAGAVGKAGVTGESGAVGEGGVVGDGSAVGVVGQETGAEEGGDRACWAHLVCPECGAVVTEGHWQGCSSAG